MEAHSKFTQESLITHILDEHMLPAVDESGFSSLHHWAMEHLIDFHQRLHTTTHMGGGHTHDAEAPP
jgi:hypothetical protein